MKMLLINALIRCMLPINLQMMVFILVVTEVHLEEGVSNITVDSPSLPPHTRQPYDSDPQEVDPRIDPRGSICEEPCVCYDDGVGGEMFVIICVRKNLTEIPERLPSQVIKLYHDYKFFGCLKNIII